MLRAGLVGYGWMAQNGHAPFYKNANDVELLAVADACQLRRQAAERDFPGVRTYPDAAQMLAGESGRLDFVDVATPPCDHAAIAILCLGHGLHVLCEKPHATSAAAAANMLDTAARHERVLFPCHNYKHAPVIRTVARLLAEGHIGKVHQVTLQTFRNTHARGVPEWRPDWRREHRYSGGGIAMDHGSHTFYLALDWLGGSPSAVTAKMTSTGKHDTEDTFSCSVTMPAGVAVAHLTWTAGVRRVEYTLHGERGAISVRDDDVELAVMGPPLAGGNGAATWTTRKEAVASDWMDASHVTWFASLFAQFQTAIAAGDWVGAEARQALTSVRLIETAYASARHGSTELAITDAQETSCLTGAIPSFS